MIRARLAPSPTGNLHLGNAWAFLLAWLFARQAGGTLVLRMEDIDPARSRPEFVQGILHDLAWLGLDWDEGPDNGGPYAPYTQSQRLARYAAALEALAAQGHTYPCYCTRKELRSLAGAPHAGELGPPYPGLCRGLSPAACLAHEAAGRRAAVRVAIPPQYATMAFEDGILGPQEFSLHEEGGDFAVRRSDGVYAYQLAVVVDDLAMNITQVVRGSDLLSSTPRQMLLAHLLGGHPPAYLHVPLLVNEAGERLAKRHDSLALCALREAGACPRAVVGWLAFWGGLVERPTPMAPQELVGTAHMAALQRQVVRLPYDCGSLLSGK
ncbi:tRNA glutamyl-Q(34) synthetase GluQRS [Desulfovibrio cuneatus]|uniref:tRNA glutamyl-Q(34) synthetase GluQRS n=1 Tax=Desulfovibrio cuneatus TaxID=159728 RepID=UPI00041742FD|nr:tRNA glutamyl-Q(34) synthetase GluQRS [Desulfovibrio cuneatus]